MKIEIELNDPKYCEGCPCMQSSHFGGSPDCGLNFNIIENQEKPCHMDKLYIRPQECKDKYEN